MNLWMFFVHRTKKQIEVNEIFYRNMCIAMKPMIILLHVIEMVRKRHSKNPLHNFFSEGFSFCFIPCQILRYTDIFAQNGAYSMVTKMAEPYHFRKVLASTLWFQMGRFGMCAACNIIVDRLCAVKKWRRSEVRLGGPVFPYTLV